MDCCNGFKTSYFSGFISFLFYVYTVLEFSYFHFQLSFSFLISLLIPHQQPEPEPVDYIDLLKTTEVSEKYWYLESVLRLEEEINRNIELIGKFATKTGESDDITMVAGIELNKVKLLKKGKLKMFRNLCLVALKEIPPIEGDKEVTVDDLEGFWCLLGIEADKHRQLVDNITKERIVKKSKVPVVKNKTTPTSLRVCKSNIDERNRKYMERMKKLKERAAKPIVRSPFLRA
ncbi:uncharacterized protein LOC128386164 [Panonychus citri]|uniref:uncharacterized protein LOC128386164 n=1 Tax=Panonychus citri TaxID=50023 RepID=UPI002306F617|nr:uncharacterized protein LOC128386164 [Panonychus citri]